VDLSYEKYFGTKAYVGVAGFYKQMSTYIVEVVNPNYDFSRYVTPSTVIPPGFNLIGEFKQPINGNGGRISGIELSGNFPLNMLTNWLDGFGVFASMSSTSSSLNLNTSGVATDGVNTGSIPLPGLSKRQQRQQHAVHPLSRQRHQRGREQEGRQVLPVRYQLQALTASGRPPAAALLFFDPLPARPTRGFF
jgi:hypothetical protein